MDWRQVFLTCTTVWCRHNQQILDGFSTAVSNRLWLDGKKSQAKSKFRMISSNQKNCTQTTNERFCLLSKTNGHICSRYTHFHHLRLLFTNGKQKLWSKMSSKHANKKVRNFFLSFSSNFVFIAKAWTDDMGKTWESFCACVSLSIWIRAFYVYHTSDIFGYVSSSIYRVDRTGLRPLWNQSCINYLGI